jgi:hypothetical protein
MTLTSELERVNQLLERIATALERREPPIGLFVIVLGYEGQHEAKEPYVEAHGEIVNYEGARRVLWIRAFNGDVFDVELYEPTGEDDERAEFWPMYFATESAYVKALELHHRYELRRREERKRAS